MNWSRRNARLSLRIAGKTVLDRGRAFADAASDLSGNRTRTRNHCAGIRSRAKLGNAVDAIRELLRGRMEVSGPVTTGQLADNSDACRVRKLKARCWAWKQKVSFCAENFIRTAIEQEWCDRRLLARIHRLTIDRLRAEIQPVSAAGFLSVPFCVAARRFRPSRGRPGRIAIGPGTTRRLRTAAGVVGIGGSERARSRLRSGMARSPLFFWARWLGAVELASKSESARICAVADKSDCTLSAGKSSSTGCAWPQRSRQWNFPPCAIGCARHVGAWRRGFFHRTCAANRFASVASGRSAVGAGGARFCHLRQL